MSCSMGVAAADALASLAALVAAVGTEQGAAQGASDHPRKMRAELLGGRVRALHQALGVALHDAGVGAAHGGRSGSRQPAAVIGDKADPAQDADITSPDNPLFTGPQGQDLPRPDYPVNTRLSEAK